MLRMTLVALWLGCTTTENKDSGGNILDGGSEDGGSADGGSSDGGAPDGGSSDGGSADGGAGDGGTSDGGTDDGGAPDGGASDGGAPDGGSADGGSADGGSADGGSAGGGAGDGGAGDGGFGDGGAGDGGFGDGGSADGGAGDGGASLDPTGNVYQLDLASGTWTEPAGVSALLSSEIGVDLLLEVRSVDPGLEIRSGWTDDTLLAQDTCVETVDFPSADIDLLPAFEVGPTSMSLAVSGYEAPIQQVVITGGFDLTGSAIDDAALTAEIDFRKWKALLKDLLGSGDPADMCDLIAGFGLSCDACASDGKAYCIPVAVESIPAELSTISLTEVTAADIHDDPACR